MSNQVYRSREEHHLIESLSDIEALAARCNSDQSKGYLSEAVICYRSGAYRASIVSTWIAVIFDLIDKIRELALNGDAAAKALEARHENYIEKIDRGDLSGIRGALEFEIEKLLRVEELELITANSQQLPLEIKCSAYT